MFWLEVCFNKYPEFCDFLEAVKVQVKIPPRKISICGGCSGDRVYLGMKESEMLWPLIERWVKTRNYSDVLAIEGAKEEI